jgi:hypothetical protein
MILKSFQFAEDWDPKKVLFPVLAQPKIDGVRGGNLFGTLTARTLRPHNNKHATLFFSQAGFRGFDGELAAEHETNPLLCSLTTSALNTHEGMPWLMWHVFDYLTHETADQTYESRYWQLLNRVTKLKADSPELGAHLSVVPSTRCANMDELEACLSQFGINGYEGGILRDPCGKHKNGRSSPTHRGLLRCKTFIEVDAIVRQIVEGKRNENEATVNRLGYTERSTHAENMVPNGMVGAVFAELCEDARHPLTKQVLFPKGEIVKFGAGRMLHADRLRYFRNPELLLGKRMKGCIFPHGIKDKARFPTFQSLRSDADTVDRR